MREGCETEQHHQQHRNDFKEDAHTQTLSLTRSSETHTEEKSGKDEAVCDFCEVRSAKGLCSKAQKQHIEAVDGGLLLFLCELTH